MSLHADPSAGKPGTQNRPRVLKTPTRILVVDDDPDLLELNAQILLRDGYHVDVAADGLAAWDILQSQCYDLLVTDNQMGRLSGVGLVGKIHAASIPLPVILACGGEPAEPVKIHALLLKPYTAMDLLGLVKSILDNFVPPSPDCRQGHSG